jgi:hypothetical protein
MSDALTIECVLNKFFPKRKYYFEQEQQQQQQ